MSEYNDNGYGGHWGDVTNDQNDEMLQPFPSELVFSKMFLKDLSLSSGLSPLMVSNVRNNISGKESQYLQTLEVLL